MKYPNIFAAAVILAVVTALFAVSACTQDQLNNPTTQTAIANGEQVATQVAVKFFDAWLASQPFGVERGGITNHKTEMVNGAANKIRSEHPEYSYAAAHKIALKAYNQRFGK